jgi:hypothetical protein
LHISFNPNAILAILRGYNFPDFDFHDVILSGAGTKLNFGY